MSISPLSISIAQINPIVGSFKHNTQLILDAIQQAKHDKADAVLFPELVLTGYPPEDLLFRPAFLKKVETALEKIATASDGITVILGAPLLKDKHRTKQKPKQKTFQYGLCLT